MRWLLDRDALVIPSVFRADWSSSSSRLNQKCPAVVIPEPGDAVPDCPIRLQRWLAQANLGAPQQDIPIINPVSSRPSGEGLDFDRQQARGVPQTHGHQTMAVRQDLIAVVDDDPDIRELVKDLLSRFGFEAETFSSAEEFFAVAPTCQASCILLDVQLGGMTGIELAHQLADLGFRFPIIFMTGSLNISIEKKAVEAGCVAYLLKPFPTEKLLHAVNKAISPKREPSMFPNGSGEHPL
jgi:CheY-like chemotaxis protein